MIYTFIEREDEKKKRKRNRNNIKNRFVQQYIAAKGKAAM
jgi:hypothetical protein